MLNVLWNLHRSGLARHTLIGTGLNPSNAMQQAGIRWQCLAAAGGLHAEQRALWSSIAASMGAQGANYTVYDVWETRWLSFAAFCNAQVSLSTQQNVHITLQDAGQEFAKASASWD